VKAHLNFYSLCAAGDSAMSSVLATQPSARNLSKAKSCRLCDYVDKYGTVGQVTEGNIIRRMRVACWVTKATDTHSEYVILTANPLQ